MPNKLIIGLAVFAATAAGESAATRPAVAKPALTAVAGTHDTSSENSRGGKVHFWT